MPTVIFATTKAELSLSLRMNQSRHLILTFLLLACCSLAMAQGPVSAAYNNMTARFNSYFYAKQRILEIEQALDDNHQWNYNKILPIYPQYDTTFSQSQETQLEDCIKKASISIQYHPGSRWEYDCYILVGKARLYGSEFPEAIETFKYVNTKSDNKQERQKALVALIRTFVEAKEYANAESASDFLSREKLTGENLKDLYLNRAYLYQKRDDLNRTVQNLTSAENLMANGKEKGRINFIIGQIYQQLGFDAQAFGHYRSTLKNSPEYELEFYTKLNMAQVTELSKTNNARRIEKYFKKLLKDPKNREYRDKIYYEIGDFELKQGHLAEAISNYKESIKESSTNQRQKSYSYLRLGEIYYDSLKDFELAKAYYDSTVQVMPQDEDRYLEIVERQEILQEFVKHIRTIRVNDSLLNLAALSEEQRISLAEEVIKERILQAERTEKEKAKQAKRARARAINNNEVVGSTISTSTEGVWYFYNISSVSRGRSEFVKTWGNRPLNDNWRLSNRASQSENQGSDEQSSDDRGEKVKETSEPDLEAQKAELLANIPVEIEDQKVLLSEIEEAYYNVGNIYNFQLEEKQNSIDAFETLITRFDTTSYKPEVLYQLFLLYNSVDTSKAIVNANKLLNEFPESVYAKLIFNPRYREETLAKNQQVQKLYADAYALYRQDLFPESIGLIDSVLSVYQESDFHDNLDLLRIINMGKLENIYQYQYELGIFIEKHPESELGDYAQRLLESSREHQINLISSSRGSYIRSFDEKHYQLIVYGSDDGIIESLPGAVEDFITESNMTLTTGNLVLDEKYSMVLVSELPGKASASSFLKMIASNSEIKEILKGKSSYLLVITKSNFEILFESKDLRGYLNFFDRYYQ